MQSKEQSLIYFKSDDGSSPFISWYSALKDRRAKAKITARVERLRFGNFGDHKSLSGGLFELKISYGPGFRVYYTRVGNQIVVLLSGGDKSSQSEDIEKARIYLEEYRRGTNAK